MIAERYSPSTRRFPPPLPYTLVTDSATRIGADEAQKQRPRSPAARASSARISPSCCSTDGWEVFVLDDLSTGSERNVAHLRERRDFHLIVDSVLKSSVVNELVHRCDVVFHLAAAVGVRLIVEEPVHTLVTNIQGTENVLDYCNRFGKRVLVASTSEVYGDRREPEPLVEDGRRMYGPTTSRRWAYAESKALDEFLALAYHQERGLDCVIVRLFNTVGPRQSGQYGMVIPRFVSAALAGRPLEIHGDGTQTRCFCHVQDTIRALTGLMDATAPRARSSTSARPSA